MEGLFTAASHHDILVLLVELAILLFAARALGEIAQRLNQPSVVGEILAGIILGPSLLSGLFPALGAWIIPQTAVQGFLLEEISLIGALLLLLITGLETDLALIRRHARTAIGVSFGGIIVTFFSGFLLGQFLPDNLLANPAQRTVFALFIATAMSISAIPVIAKVLMDLNLMRRDIGQTIIAAGMSDDTIGWILLSIVVGLASGQAISAGTILQIVGSVLGFMVLSFTLGRWLVKKALDFVQDEVVSHDRLLTLVIVLTFVWGAITQALNLEAVLGAFVMGILLGQMPRLPKEIRHKLESMALGVFTPIFFAVAGLKVNLVNLFQPQLLLIALLVIFVATFGKVVGTYAGARLIGRRDHWTALSFGAGLNARGAMEIIIATIGLSLGILTQDMFSIIVVMAMATSLMAPTALRFVLKHVQPEEQELQRLKREELAAGSLVAGIHRVLLPVRQREQDNMAVQTIEARLLERMGARTNLSLTLLTVTGSGQKAVALDFLRSLSRLFTHEEVLRKVVEANQPISVILDEAAKNYDLLVLGASERPRESNVVFTPLVDSLVRMSPCTTMIVKGPRAPADWEPHRILVPTNGSRSARHAAEIAFALTAPQRGEEVVILHVTEENDHPYHYREETSQETSAKEDEKGQIFVNHLRNLGQSVDAQAETVVHRGGKVEQVILDMAEKNQMDLIVLGTDLRPGSDRLFLGPRVEYILENATCPVIIVNAR
jgi:Kef-type K+ transport system membrane component KefB